MCQYGKKKNNVKYQNIRIYQACRVMTKGNAKEKFSTCPLANGIFFFWHTVQFLYFLKKIKFQKFLYMLRSDVTF